MPHGEEVALITLASGFTAVMVLATIGFTVILIIRTARGGSLRKREKLDAGETQIIQEIYQGLSKMDKRIESLETLILDADRAKQKQFDQDLRKE
jgi:phage shock protein B